MYAYNPVPVYNPHLVTIKNDALEPGAESASVYNPEFMQVDKDIFESPKKITATQTGNWNKLAGVI